MKGLVCTCPTFYHGSVPTRDYGCLVHFPNPKWKHGRNCYINHGCRCETCRREHAKYHKGRYRRRCDEQRAANGI